MKRLMTLKKSLMMVAGLLTLGSLTHASLASANAPANIDMYVVMFRADWCGPCKIVEPNLDRALNVLADPGIEYVTIDITTPGRSEASAHRAFDRNFVPQYNQWMGVTGFAAIIDADTKRTLGCVNLTYSTDAVIMHLRNLKTYAVSNQMTQDITCPAPNPPR